MPPDRLSFTALNVPDDEVPEWMGSFTLAAPPNTDLWRKPPSRDTSTAPILYTALRNPFIAAEVTVSADWELEWDQAGLVIFAGAPPGPPGRTGNSSPQHQQPTPLDVTHSSPSDHVHDPPPAYLAPAPASKWVKVGLEFCNNACHASSVCATSDGADWALSALPPHHARRLDLRVKMERIGYALWVYYRDEVAGWKKVREVTWFFWGVEDKAVRVGVYASRPANVGVSVFEQRRMIGGGGGGGGMGMGFMQRNLCVDFEGLEIY
ncbi:uncharacterized protein EI97DRAFT_373814 [Westerdykella ornata]|uniref:Uncharacterized protein n=1 Tax=Westerdykella ornata TaxID=318751 RepID=A0A6A6JM85_WESOR|nr:uncharacterized protein EI97DRAFT_373814 [Westerdykella ornata]KAF2277701.1 hypothetical protein EI97DRAFT_373814 [Westerdykella ornata]